MNSSDLTEKQKAVQEIKEAKHILLAISQRPTGDQIGSLLALAEGLRLGKKNIFFASGSQLDDRYSYLSGFKNINYNLTGSKDFILQIDQKGAKADHLGYKMEDGKLKITITPEMGNFEPDDVSYSYGDYQYDLIITLGVSELKTLGKLYEDDPEIFYKTKTINIDNNAKNQQYGEINWLDKKSSSLSEMMVSIMEALEIDLNEEIATALLTGLISSTNRFQDENTTSKALTVAAQLMAAGADRSKIINNLYDQTPYLYLKGWGRIMENLNLDPALNFAFSNLSKKDLTELKIEGPAINQALDKLLSNIKEARIAALIQQTDDGVKVSLRSGGEIDVSTLAKKYDGGGQKTKAGFDLKGDYEDLKKKSVRLIKDYLKENL